MAKKSSLKSKALTAAAAMVAAGAGLVSSPAGQQTAEMLTQQAQQTQVVQQQRTARQARASQQSTQQAPQKVVVSSQAVYLPWRKGDRIYGKYTMTPKEYGEYLMRTGKDKYNKRRRKHWAKAWA
jgi:hypothetical protein